MRLTNNNDKPVKPLYYLAVCLNLNLITMQKLKLAVLLIILTAAVSCKKEHAKPEQPEATVSHPPMTYIDLSGKSMAFKQSLVLDLDKDGKNDLIFYTERVSYDMNTKVKNVYRVLSTSSCKLAVDTTDESTPVLSKGMSITNKNLLNYQWYEVAQLDLMQKIQNGGVYWEGPWKDKDHEYLPLQLLSGGKTYMGWVEMGTDKQQERLIFYRAAICQQPGVTIKAGM